MLPKPVFIFPVTTGQCWQKQSRRKLTYSDILLTSKLSAQGRETFRAEGRKGETVQHHLYASPGNSPVHWTCSQEKLNCSYTVMICTEWAAYLALVFSLKTHTCTHMPSLGVTCSVLTFHKMQNQNKFRNTQDYRHRKSMGV